MNSSVIYNILFLTIIIGLVLYIHNTSKVYEGITNLVGGDPIRNDIDATNSTAPVTSSLYNLLSRESTLNEDIMLEYQKLRSELNLVDTPIDQNPQIDRKLVIKQKLASFRTVNIDFIDKFMIILQNTIQNPTFMEKLKTITDPQVIQTVKDLIFLLVCSYSAGIGEITIAEYYSNM